MAIPGATTNAPTPAPPAPAAPAPAAGLPAAPPFTDATVTQPVPGLHNADDLTAVDFDDPFVQAMQRAMETGDLFSNVQATLNRGTDSNLPGGSGAPGGDVLPGTDSANPLAASAAPANSSSAPPADGTTLTAASPNTTDASTSSDASTSTTDPGVGAAGVEPFAFNWNGQQVALDHQSATQLMDTAAWVQSKPQELWNAVGALERGEAIMLSRADYDTLIAARDTAISRAATPTTPTVPPPVPTRFNENDFLDARTFQQAQRLADEQYQRDLRAYQEAVAPAPAPAPALASQPQPQPQARPNNFGPEAIAAATQMEREGIRREGIINEVTATFLADHGLTAADADLLHQQTLQMGVVQSLLEQATRRAPDGTVLAQPDLHQVYRTAFTAAAATHPQLSTKIDQYRVSERVAAEQAANAKVDAKRQRGSAVNTMPSAAVTPLSTDVRTMSTQEIEAAIAQELRSQWGS